MIAEPQRGTRHETLTGTGEVDDRILPATRSVAIVLVGILAVGASLLYIWPLETDSRFAWPISPEMTPLLMGSGYYAGAYYFLRMAIGRSWSRTGTTTPAVATFATIMLIVTLMHWGNFTHDHLAFYIWFIVYVIAPPLVLAIWYFNGKRDPGPVANDKLVPGFARIGVLALGAGATALAAVMFFAPEMANDFWVWAVSPLTARILAGWFMLSAVTSFVLAYDQRWAIWRIPLETMLIWCVLILAAVPRAWNDFSPTPMAPWLVVGFVSAVGLGTIAFYVYMNMVNEEHSGAEA
jgi:hypothetical protein